MNIAAGWINVYTPPRGLILNSDIYVVPYLSVISAVQDSFIQPPLMLHIPSTPTPFYIGTVELPPPPNYTPIVPPSVNSTSDGVLFCQSGLSSNPNVSVDDNSTLGNAYGTILVVNGRPINGYFYDANGNHISWLLRQLFGTTLHKFGHFLITIFKYIEPSSTVHIGYVISTTGLYISLSHFNTYAFCHTILSESEHLNLLSLVIDTWANIVCAGKHEFAEELVMGDFITEKCFTTDPVSIENLPIAIFFYSYDAENGETMVL